MIFKKASLNEINTVKQIIHNTILNVYPKYYPEGVVDYFINLHSEEHIKIGIEKGFVLLLEYDGEFIGTGNTMENEIGGVYIYPQFQRKGYGTELINKLQNHIKDNGYTSIGLASSMAAYDLYLKLGYVPLRHHKIFTDDGSVLFYFEMEKKL